MFVLLAFIALFLFIGPVLALVALARAGHLLVRLEDTTRVLANQIDALAEKLALLEARRASPAESAKTRGEDTVEDASRAAVSPPAADDIRAAPTASLPAPPIVQRDEGPRPIPLAA